MKMLYSYIFLLLLNMTSYTQVKHVIEATLSNTFAPADLTISTGDTVQWVNSGGIHNVVADDGTFNSGPVSSALWVYEYVFTQAGNYGYYCEAHGGPGGVGMSGTITVQFATDVEEDKNVLKYKLDQNYPNPFNPATSISITIEKTGFTELLVYNLIGEKIASLISQMLTPGNYSFNFNAANLPSGTYFYRLSSGDFVEVRKMILLR